MSDSTQRTKCCTKCGLCKPLEAFPSDRRELAQRSQCSSCKAEYRRKKWAEDPAIRERAAEQAKVYWSDKQDKRREIQARYDAKNKNKRRAYYEANKERLIAQCRRRESLFSEADWERVKAQKAKSTRNACRQLRDSYINGQLAKLGCVNPPAAVVDLKREHLRLQRLVSELKQAQPKGTK